MEDPFLIKEILNRNNLSINIFNYIENKLLEEHIKCVNPLINIYKRNTCSKFFSGGNLVVIP